jgi:hypothetical protein
MSLKTEDEEEAHKTISWARLHYMQTKWPSYAQLSGAVHKGSGESVSYVWGHTLEDKLPFVASPSSSFARALGTSFTNESPKQKRRRNIKLEGFPVRWRGIIIRSNKILTTVFMQN